MDLVTGGMGFIGSHLVDRLVRDGRRVRVLDIAPAVRFGTPPDAFRDADIITGDIRDGDTVARAMAGVDTVYHQAALASVPESVADPLGYYDANVTGTLKVLLAARNAGVRRVVFASSSAVYGDSPAMPKVETMLPEPISPYASSKLAGEALCQVFTKSYGLEAVALRYFNVFGPRQDPNSAYAAVVPRFLAALAAGEQPVIYGDGGQSRDFVFVADVVAAHLLAATAPDAPGRVFNIASGSAITLNAMLTVMADALGMTTVARYEPGRAGDVRHSLADIGLARAVLGFAPAVAFAEGLRRTAESVMVEAVMAGR